MILTDAGALVAILDADDRHHPQCRDFVKRLRMPLASIWPTITEAMYLLRTLSVAHQALLSLIENEHLLVLPIDSRDAARIRALMHTYRDQPMDFADAALVRVAERERLRRIFTLDRRHFGVYRAAGIGRLTIVP